MKPNEDDKPTKRLHSVTPEDNEDAQTRLDEARTVEHEKLAYARSFDRLIDVNMSLVRSVKQLVKISYVVQLMQLFCLLVMFIYVWVKR